MNHNDGGGILVFLLALYFVPAVIAFARSHHQRAAILVLNLFLGWTFIGWIAALIWSATAKRRDFESSTSWPREVKSRAGFFEERQ